MTNRVRLRFNPIFFFLHSNCGNSGLRQEKGETSSTAMRHGTMRGLNEFLSWGDVMAESWAEVMALNRGDLPVLVARRPFRKFCRQRAGAPELKECYVNGKRTLLHSLANNMNVDMGDIRRHHLWNVVYHVWARWCIRPIHSSYVGAVHSMWKNSLWTVHEWCSAAALVSKQHECRYGRHSEPAFQKRCLSCLGQVVHPAHTR